MDPGDTDSDPNQPSTETDSSSIARRGVLAALGLGGLATLGSSGASAQAAGQVGTPTSPINMYAYDLDVANAVTSSLPMNGNDIEDAGSVNPESLSGANIASAADGEAVVSQGDGTLAFEPVSGGGGVDDWENVLDYGAIGDGSTNDLGAFEDARNAAGSDGVIFVPPGEYVLSAPLELQGTSIVGAGKFKSLLLADPDSTDSTYSVGSQPNDVSLVYQMDESNVTFKSVGVDGQEQYTGGMSAWGCKGVTFTDCFATRCANAAIQSWGSWDDNTPSAENVLMTGCVSVDNAWNLVADGEHYNINITGNISRTPTNRHISVDPADSRVDEYAGGSGEIRSANVSENVCMGRRSVPSEWDYTDTTYDADNAIIGDRGDLYARISDNYIFEWDADVGINHAPGIQTITGNVVHRFTDTGINVESQSDGSSLTNNTMLGITTGIDLSSADTTGAVVVGGNNFTGATTSIDDGGSNTTEWSLYDNYDETGSEVSPDTKSGTTTLSSGTATIDTGVSTAETATFGLFIGPQTDDADVAGDIRADSGTGTYVVDIEETDTSIGDPDVAYDIVRQR